jgi:hypothetical protein
MKSETIEAIKLWWNTPQDNMTEEENEYLNGFLVFIWSLNLFLGIYVVIR